jgi:putative ABC transport system permease protein
MPGLAEPPPAAVWLLRRLVKGVEPTLTDKGAYAVSAGYFESFGLSRLRGRLFSAGDVPGSPPVVVLSERAADLLWPGEDAVGKQIRYPGAESWLTVIGVVSDRTRLSAASPSGEYGMRAERWPYVYAAASQIDAAPSTMFWLRPQVGSGPLNEILRATVTAVDPRLTFSARSVWEMDYETHQATYRLVGRVLNAFGLIAALLSALGTYSVMSLAWTQRAREVGVRMAFGATSREVVGLVLRHGQRMAVVGVVVGTAISAAVYRLAAGVFFDVRPWDPLSYAGVAALLSAMVVLAGLGPARSAIRNDPVEVLRQE